MCPLLRASMPSKEGIDALLKKASNPYSYVSDYYYYYYSVTILSPVVIFVLGP